MLKFSLKFWSTHSFMVHFRLLKNVVPPPKTCLFKVASKLVKLNVDFLQSVYYRVPVFDLSSSWNSIPWWYLGWIVLLSSSLKWFISRLDLILVQTKSFLQQKMIIERSLKGCLSHPQFVLETMGTLNEHLEGTNSFVNLVGVHISMRRSRLTRNFVLKLDICEE